jgi:hypothetical protein
MTSGQTPVEFIGMIGTRVVSEIHPASEPPLDPAVVRRFVDAHEQGGFDRVLVGHSASTPDGLQVAAYAAADSERLGFLVAHRPGFVAPTLAARSFATRDLGVTTLLIRGYDPIDDAIAYGRDLLPLVRAELAHRARVGAPA